MSGPISALAEAFWSGALDRRPLFAAIYTHGHADHALGLPPFLAEARERGWPRPRIVAHRNVSGRFERYRRTNGYNALIPTSCTTRRWRSRPAR